MAKGNPQPGSITCPSCGHAMAPRKIHEHTSMCEAWLSEHGKPWPHFKYDRWSGKKGELFKDDAKEGIDFVRCLVCFEHGWDFRFSRLVHHLKAHEMDEASYKILYPKAKIRLDKTLQRRIETTRREYGVDNVFQAEKIKAKSRETMLERYGVEHNNYIPESQAKRAATNLERRGVENPFAAAEVKEKIRASMLERHGAENPQQVPEIRARTVETCRERYGTDNYVESEDFREKFTTTCQERYGADHHMQSEAWVEDSGWVSGFTDPEVQKKAYETNLQNHGGRHSQQCAEVLAKARATWMEKYGVDNPSKCDEVKARIKEVWLGKNGVPFPPQSLWMNRKNAFPNNLEKKVDSLSPECVVYAGDGSYWVRHKGATKARNPDFVVLKRKQVEAYQTGVSLNDLRTSAIIEVFGDYWHGPTKTGKSRAAHKAEVEKYYARCGIVCLVLWEHEVKGHPKRVAERIQRFLSKWRRGVYRGVREETIEQDVLSLFGE